MDSFKVGCKEILIRIAIYHVARLEPYEGALEPER